MADFAAALGGFPNNHPRLRIQEMRTSEKCRIGDQILVRTVDEAGDFSFHIIDATLWDSGAAIDLYTNPAEYTPPHEHVGQLPTEMAVLLR